MTTGNVSFCSRQTEAKEARKVSEPPDHPSSPGVFQHWPVLISFPTVNSSRLERQRQENHEFKATMGYTHSFRLAWTPQRDGGLKNKAKCDGTHTYSQHPGGQDKQISESEATMAYNSKSRPDRAT